MDIKLEKYEQLKQLLGDYRESVTNQINNLIESSRTVAMIADTKVLSLSLRHKINDKIRELSMILANYNQQMDVEFTRRYQVLKNNRVADRDIRTHVESELIVLKKSIDLLDVEKDFLVDCTKLLVSLDFKMKQTLDFEQSSY